MVNEVPLYSGNCRRRISFLPAVFGRDFSSDRNAVEQECHHYRADAGIAETMVLCKLYTRIASLHFLQIHLRFEMNTDWGQCLA